MMNLYLRLMLTLLYGRFHDKCYPLQTTTSRYRVMPWDIDVFGHMNNGRYLQICDLARVNWMQRTGVLDVLLQHRWHAVLGGTLVRYSKALKPWQQYQVRTQLISWDTRWFFIKHRFIDKQNRETAVCLTRAALRHKSQWVETSQVVELVHAGLDKPNNQALVNLWMETDELLVSEGSAQ